MITITYVYEHEEFARNTFDDLVAGSKIDLYKRVQWSKGVKEIVNESVMFRFVYYKTLDTTQRGYKTDYIYFEPSLVGKLTHQQVTCATFMLFNSEHRYGYLTLDGFYEANRRALLDEH